MPLAQSNKDLSSITIICFIPNTINTHNDKTHKFVYDSTLPMIDKHIISDHYCVFVGFIDKGVMVYLFRSRATSTAVSIYNSFIVIMTDVYYPYVSVNWY